MADEKTVLFVPAPIVAAMRSAAQDALPEEACGLLFGRGRTAERAVPIENVFHSPVRFRLEPLAQLTAMRAAEDDGLDLLAIFHSHPHGPDCPSTTDMQEAAYPQAAFLIWWIDSSGLWKCNLFWLRGVGEAAGVRGYTRGVLRAAPPNREDGGLEEG